MVLNADDFGYDPSVSAGIVRAMRKGVVSSTTLMVNTPFSAMAAETSEGLSLGLHLNLARWRSLCVPSHEFVESGAPALEMSFVCDETMAQLNRLDALVGRKATHIDVHKHLHRHPSVLEGVCRAAVLARLPVRSVDASMRSFLRARGVNTNDVFIGDAGSEAYWSLEVFEKTLGSLPQTGFIELMCHPGFAPSAVESRYAQQREVELATFTSDDARLVMATHRVQFEAWA